MEREDGTLDGKGGDEDEASDGARDSIEYFAEGEAHCHQDVTRNHLKQSERMKYINEGKRWEGEYDGHERKKEDVEGDANSLEWCAESALEVGDLRCDFNPVHVAIS